jgi:hypothetical protein
MGSSSSTSGGGGRSRTTTSGYQGTIGPKKTILSKRTTPYKEPGMGPAESIARSGTTGLATATPKEAETIRAATGKSFNAISKNIGEVGSKYRRPADVEKYAKSLERIEEGKAKGAKTFVGPDGIERVSFVGTGMKDEQGRTILSRQTPELTAQAPTLRQLGGDIVRGVMGYNTLKYTDSSNIPTMVREKGLIEMSPSSVLLNAFNRAGSFFKFGGSDSKSEPTTKTTEMATESDIRDNERKLKLEKRLAALGSTTADNTRPFLTISRRGFGGTMS